MTYNTCNTYRQRPTEGGLQIEEEEEPFQDLKQPNKKDQVNQLHFSSRITIQV